MFSKTLCIKRSVYHQYIIQGGQILRIALSLSALYGIPIEINNIRAGRAKPGLAGKTGLAAQHLKGIYTYPL